MDRWTALTQWLNEIVRGALAQENQRRAAGDANYLVWEGRRRQAEEALQQMNSIAATYPERSAQLEAIQAGQVNLTPVPSVDEVANAVVARLMAGVPAPAPVAPVADDAPRPMPVEVPPAQYFAQLHRIPETFDNTIPAERDADETL